MVGIISSPNFIIFLIYLYLTCNFQCTSLMCMYLMEAYLKYIQGFDSFLTLNSTDVYAAHNKNLKELKTDLFIQRVLNNEVANGPLELY